MTKSTARRVFLGIATVCYLGAIGAAVGALLVHPKTANDALSGALIGTAIYLVLCGAALHVAVKVMIPKHI